MKKQKFDQNNNYNSNKLNISDLSINAKSIERFKVILIGDSSVGKTSILNRFVHNKFKNEYKCTIGVDYCVKSLVLDKNITVDLRLWDTCGLERFKTLTRQYYQNTNGCLLVFDLSSKITFKNIEIWLDDVKKFGNEDLITLLVGNKSDLNENREVQVLEIKELISRYNISYIEVSAKTGDSVKLAFESLTNLIIKKNEELISSNKLKVERESLNVKSISLNESIEKEIIKDKKGCCS